MAKINQNESNQSHKFTVTAKAELLGFILSSFDGISRNKAKAILANSAVKVNNRIVTQYDFGLEPGMKVEINKRKGPALLKNPYVTIVFEDRWIVVIDKKPGILSMFSRGSINSVKTVLDNYYQSIHKPTAVHVVHRLDRDTSGLMVYAKSIEVQKILETNWRSLVTNRRYYALVSGHLEPKSGQISSWLKESKSLKIYSSSFDNGGKYAVTDYNVVSEKNGYSLLDIKLHTGRKNQIRVHLSEFGHPVVGDFKYGSNDDSIKRLGLHAYLLELYHPITRELLQFRTDFPHEFKKVIN